ncbi:MAG: hypothetical protein EOP84_28140 [Verrucomicrobiaceae bacterium]|nr:MAG: hypothetical protein EOP84_28140 [Verrucomicrobiaceae bacterium]
MKVIGTVEIEGVSDVVCDFCRLTTRVNGGGLQFATLQAHWGYGSKHDGERWEIHLCEDCFFQAVAGLKQERRIHGIFDESGGMPDDDFGLITKDDFFKDRG